METQVKKRRGEEWRGEGEEEEEEEGNIISSSCKWSRGDVSVRSAIPFIRHIEIVSSSF